MAIVVAAVLLGIRSLLSTFQADSMVGYLPNQTTSAALAYSLAAVVLAAVWLLRRNRGRGTTKITQNQRPPWAPGVQLPFLGHALSYKADPPTFLRRASEQVGPVFCVNLAGLKTTIVSSRSAMKAVANAPESQLSARQAVSDFGFRYTLGDANVFSGTDIHKHVLKAFVYAAASSASPDPSHEDIVRSSQSSSGRAAQQNNPTLQLAAALAPRVNDGLERAFPRNQDTCHDFLGAMRRVAFHAVAGHLIGPQVLEAYRNFSVNGRAFVDDFMAFQDQVEEATAKGATLPAPLARALMWQPAQRQREELTCRLASAIAAAAAFAITAEATHNANQRDKVDGNTNADSARNSLEPPFDDGLGIWLRAALKGEIAKKTSPSSPVSAGPASSSSSPSSSPVLTTQEARDLNEEEKAPPSPNMSFAECADLLVGLLFAAHKNPAIAAAQAVLMAIEDHVDTVKQISSSASKAQSYLGKIGTEAAGGIVDSSATVGVEFGTNASSEVVLRRPNMATLVRLFPANTEPSSTGEVSAPPAERTTSKATTTTTVTWAVVNEAMRLSAHSLGAIRKVVEPAGFAIPLEEEKSSLEGSSKDATSDKTNATTTTAATASGTTTAPAVVVPCGEYVGVSHLLPHFNPNVFPHPSRFLPSRFLPTVPSRMTDAASASTTTTREEVSVRGSALGLSPYDLTTFSHGIHVCPGQRYAQVLVQLMVAAVVHGPLHQFLAVDNSETPPGTTIPPLDFTRATLAQRKGPVVLPYKWL